MVAVGSMQPMVSYVQASALWRVAADKYVEALGSMHPRMAGDTSSSWRRCAPVGRVHVPLSKVALGSYWLLCESMHPPTEQLLSCRLYTAL